MRLGPILKLTTVAVSSVAAMTFASSLPAFAAGAPNGASVRSASPRVAASEIPAAEAATPEAAALTGTSSGIVALAEANIGRGACGRNSLGGLGYGTSCTGDGGSPEYWCADFAKWVWANAGVDDTGWLDAAAGTFYTYGLEYGTLSANPAVGDAEIFDYDGDGYAAHVAIVTGVSSNGTVTSVSGDWNGTGATESAFSSSSAVVANTPAYQAVLGEAPSVMGMTISGYVAPVGVAAAAVVGGQSVPAGELQAGWSATSPNGDNTLVMQTDGNLVEYAGTRPLWWTGTGGNPGAYAAMQTDGNLVVYSATGSALWQSGTSGHPGATLDVRNNASISVVDAGTSEWTAAPSVWSLATGATLTTGQTLRSANGVYQLDMQRDGNLVETTAGRVLWDTATSSPGARLAMQTDGNLVVYSAAGRALWQSGTSGNADATAVLADTGAMVVDTSRGTIYDNWL